MVHNKALINVKGEYTPIAWQRHKHIAVNVGSLRDVWRCAQTSLVVFGCTK
jgi:hypothetical protein